MLEVTGITVLLAGHEHVIRTITVLMSMTTMVLAGRYDYDASQTPETVIVG
jgi:hypothetical protein